MKFLVDMPLSPNLARWLQTQGHDAVHASAIRLHRADDSAIIARANAERRTVITADLDYPRLLATAGATGPSLILFRGGDWADAEVLARLAAVFAMVSESDIEGSVLVIERDRVRRRRLPIT